MDAANVIQLGAPPAVRRMNIRQPVTSHPVRVRFGAFELDESNALLRCNGKAVTLPPKPFGVLCALARRPGCLVTKDALLEMVWGHCFVTESALKTAISEVRAALDDDPKHPRHIETISRRGYRFIAAMAESATGSDHVALQSLGAGRDHPAFTALKTLCRGDAALADVIRSVAAALEHERPLVTDS